MGIMRLQRWIRLKKAQIYTMLARSDFGRIGKGSLIICPFISFNPKGIFLGEKVTINSGSWIDCISEYEGIKFNSRLEVGDGTYIGNRAHIIACCRMVIGKDVAMGDGVYITDNIHGYEDITKGIIPQPLTVPGPVLIEDQAWIGERVCIMPNVTIGKHAIIGSNAVVTKSIPPYSVAIGIPAKVIRQYNQETKCWQRV